MATKLKKRILYLAVLCVAGVICTTVVAMILMAPEQSSSDVYDSLDTSLPAISIVEIVDDQGSPILGATVEVLADRTVTRLSEIGSGQYEFPANVANKEVAVVAKAKGHSVSSVSFRVGAGSRHQVVLSRFATLYVHLVGSGGENVKNAPVLLALPVPSRNRRGTTNSNGIARFDKLDAGVSYAVWFLGSERGELKGQGDQELLMVELQPGEERTVHAFTGGGSAVLGRVVDRDGRPVEAAVVRIMRVTWINGAVLSDDCGQTITKRDGRFRIPHDLVGDCVIKVTWQDDQGGAHLIRRKHVLQRTLEDLGDLAESHSIELAGRVDSEGGFPHGGTVSIWIDTEKLSIPLDERGLFRASVPWTDQLVQIVVTVPNVGQSRKEILLANYDGEELFFWVRGKRSGAVLFECAAGYRPDAFNVYLSSTIDVENTRMMRLTNGERIMLPVGPYVGYITSLRNAKEPLSSTLQEFYVSDDNEISVVVDLRPAPLLRIERSEATEEIRCTLETIAGIALSETALSVGQIDARSIVLPQLAGVSFRIVWWKSGAQKETGGNTIITEGMVTGGVVSVVIE